MITVKCIEKFRNNQGKIYGYKLQDINGQTQDVTADNLKKAIINKTVNVVNLTLTSDNRLINTTEDKLQSTKLGNTPVQESIKKMLEVAKILCDKFGYTLNKNDIKDDYIVIEKNGKINSDICIESYEDFLHVSMHLNDFAFEKCYDIPIDNNWLSEIRHIVRSIDNVKTAEDILRLTNIIVDELTDGIEEIELANILNKLYKIYGLKTETEELIQQRILRLISSKQYKISMDAIVDASEYLLNHRYNKNDKEIITETLKAGIWYEAIKGSGACGESAIYAQRSGAYKSYKYTK